MSDIDWNDLNYCLAVIRAGSVTAAAQQLGVNHTTVSRRITALEKRLEITLFDRSTTGWLVTPIGESIIANIEQMEDNVNALMRSVSASNTELSGNLRVTALDVCVLRIILPYLKAFTDTYPDITLELLSTDDVLDLSVRAADVAFRTTNEPAPEVIGHKIAELAYAVYARKDVYQRYLQKDNSIAAIDWNGPGTEAPDWVTNNFPRMSVRYRTNSLNVVLGLLLQGDGFACLPCGLGDIESTLTRVPAKVTFTINGFWLLTHTDLRTTPRIRIFRDFFMEKIKSRIPLLEGECPEAYTMDLFQDQLQTWH